MHLAEGHDLCARLPVVSDTCNAACAAVFKRPRLCMGTKVKSGLADAASRRSWIELRTASSLEAFASTATGGARWCRVAAGPAIPDMNPSP